VEHEGRKEERACFRIRPSRAGNSNLEGIGPMKDRLIRVLAAIGAVAATALAGGASFKGF
jgi:hypothetical protein